jgi:TM2 domain-containing membrane protein YozV
MKGSVLAIDDAKGTGVISGEDGNRYSFSIKDVQNDAKISRASNVDFTIEGETAKDVYRSVGAVENLAGDKNKVVAGLLALFFGPLGIHKFYLGKKSAGITMLLISVLGVVLIGIPTAIMAMIAFIEAIIYFLKPADEFQRLYVDGNKSWF